MISNIIFYLLILFHTFVVNKYGSDNLIQVAIYIALSFSSIAMEELIRRKINEIKLISVIDFIARIITLLLHFSWIYFHSNIYIVSFIIIILFSLNILIEIYLIRISKNFNESKAEVINDKEINDFIHKFYNNKLDTFKCSLKIKSEIKEIMNTLQISGKVNLIGILLFIGIFISSFIYKYFNNFILLDVLLICILLLIFINMNSKLVMVSLRKEKNKIKKSILENLSFVIGYTVLFISEVVLQEKLHNIRVSIFVVAILTILPLLNRRYLIKEELRRIYKEYSSLYVEKSVK